MTPLKLRNQKEPTEGVGTAVGSFQPSTRLGYIPRFVISTSHISRGVEH
jgi:hypothetical protein